MRSPLEELLSLWQQRKKGGEQITHIECIPARTATFGPWPEALRSDIIESLAKRGIHQLYSHQSAAVEASLQRKDTVIVTSTASGKSLCYNLPVFNSLYDGATALYIFPTKALSRDQKTEINLFLDLLQNRPENSIAEVYDGDTPKDIRSKIRDEGHLIITNPDMLSASILPNHRGWRRLFENLRYVVIDELHSYRGLFGNHVANVIRRLNRICAHYHSSLTFITTSATIRNPRELAFKLTDHDPILISDDGSPSGQKFVCLFNPKEHPATKERRSPFAVAANIAAETIRQNLGTIIFARSRRSVETTLRILRERRGIRGTDFADRIFAYRGGYLPDLRRDIEKGLKTNQILGVVSTNALELGIDIGSLDVCLIAGYPGTIASTWQQLGRAGRKGGVSLGVVIANNTPLDQYIINHPDYFFSQSPEAALIAPNNLSILSQHLECSAFELAFHDGEPFGTVPGNQVSQILNFVAQENNNITFKDGVWCKSNASAYPASQISLRQDYNENFTVHEETPEGDITLAEVDFESAHTQIHPKAIYSHLGQKYEVESLDYETRKAYVRHVKVDFTTTATSVTSVIVQQILAHNAKSHRETFAGEVMVSTKFIGFKKIKDKTRENIGYGTIALPSLSLYTVCFWLELDAAYFPELQNSLNNLWATAVNGVAYALRLAAFLHLMCSPEDIGLSIGSLDEDLWFTNDSSSGEFALTNAATGSIIDGDDLSKPSIFLYDNVNGGVGFAERLYDDENRLIELALNGIQKCDCEHGCPSCTGPNSNREASQMILSRLLGDNAT